MSIALFFVISSTVSKEVTNGDLDAASTMEMANGKVVYESKTIHDVNNSPESAIYTSYVWHGLFINKHEYVPLDYNWKFQKFIYWTEYIIDLLVGVGLTPEMHELTQYNYDYFPIQILFPSRNKRAFKTLSRTVLMYLGFLLLAHAGDCELNPGPGEDDSCSEVSLCCLSRSLHVGTESYAV